MEEYKCKFNNLIYRQNGDTIECRLVDSSEWTKSYGFTNAGFDLATDLDFELLSPPAPDQNGNAFSAPPVEHKAVCVPETPKPEPQWPGRDFDGLTFTDRKMLTERVERQKAEESAIKRRAHDLAVMADSEEARFDGEWAPIGTDRLNYQDLVGRKLSER